MEEMDIPHGTVLYGSGEQIKYIYFPETTMISVVAHTEEGQSAEVGLIGYEGVIGLDCLLGGDFAFNEHVAQLPGRVLRLKAAAAKKEFRRGGNFHDLITRFTRNFLLQISQTALCNRLHSLEERLARWILMSDDRSMADRIALTHELLSIMVGSTRASVTRMAIAMQKAGYFTYSRGSIRMLDRKGLEAFTCECYETVKQAGGWETNGNKAE
jgi:CRP-like cAMP-binding protein